MKQAIYAQFGVAEYWVVDPDRPSVTVLELVGDEYEHVAHVERADRFRHERLGVEFAAADLVARVDD
ncbi:MAG: Uma2 family endonuclease [Actinomycetota bacterium]